MNTTPRTYDTLYVGRSSIDLYANEIGAPFEEIKSFAAYVGGSPTNISVGARRLGLKAALLTGLGEDIDVPGFPVEIYNILGAGDAFAAGFLYGYVKDWGWYKSAGLGNACGAIVVTRHGCANFMQTLTEVEDFVEGYGGL